MLPRVTQRVTPWVTISLYENFVEKNTVPHFSFDFFQNLRIFFYKIKVTRGKALFPAKLSYKLMVTRGVTPGVTLGNTMQHGL